MTTERQPAHEAPEPSAAPTPSPPRWPWLAGLALITAALTVLWWPPPPEDALIGKPAPGFALPLVAGGALEGPAQHANQLVLLHFWGPSCPPCVAEIDLWQQLAERGRRDGFAVLTVTADEPASVQAFVAARRLSLPVLLDATARVHGAYGVRSLPTTVAIARDGRVTAVLEGARPPAHYTDLLTP